MLRIQLIGLALMAALVMSVVAASSASAAHLWLLGGKLIASPVTVHSKGALLLVDDNAPGGRVAVKCTGFDTGTVGPHALDLVSKVTAELLGTNDKITCSFEEKGLCSASPAPLALAVNLPWHTEIYLVGTEVRDMIVSDGAGNPGWSVTCTVLGSPTTDTCTAKLGSTGLENFGTAGVLAKFDAKTEVADCTLGGTGQGLVRGPDLIESPSGATLSFL